MIFNSMAAAPRLFTLPTHIQLNSYYIFRLSTVSVL